jgi:hypothetical protein
MDAVPSSLNKFGLDTMKKRQVDHTGDLGPRKNSHRKTPHRSRSPSLEKSGSSSVFDLQITDGLGLGL